MNDFQTLPSNKRIKLLAELKKIHLKKKKQERREILIPCPYCGSREVHKNGKRKDGTQTFVCVNCRKAYNERTGTCFHNVKMKEKMHKCIQLMSRGYLTLEEMSTELGVSIMTAFEWRHKILSALDPETFIIGNLQMQTVYIPCYNKGKKALMKKKNKKNENLILLLVSDSQQKVDLQLCSVGHLKTEDVPHGLTNTLIHANSVSSPNIFTFSSLGKKYNEIPFNFINKENESTSEKLSLSNTLKNELYKWIFTQMRGVSGKYVQNYAHWFRQISEYAKAKNEKKFRKYLTLTRKAWVRYALSEKHFELFIDQKAGKYQRGSNKKWISAENYTELLVDEESY